MSEFEIKSADVNIWGLQLEMQPVLREAAALWKQHGETLVVTSARDGMHSPGSLHYYGLAVDLRTRDFSESVKAKVVDLLRGRLATHSMHYDVVPHSTHLHVEYDPPYRRSLPA